MTITINNINDIFGAKIASIDTMQYKGYKLLKEYFIDNSGLGGSNEPALTKIQFESELQAFLAGYGKPVTAKITRHGQFQVYLGLFAKTGQKISKKIANNTLLIKDNNKNIIRLHDTNILIESGGIITINSDGYQSKTTKSRINDYLPNGYYISQKDFAWYLNTPESTIDFVDGMTIKGYLNI